ncbi:MAG: hypothetical protein M3N30_10275 [Bacteroidota bacterium]|nr:hypothetical protein [Bacteroidota bacterium]
MLRLTYIFIIITAVLCLLIKIAYHIYRKIKPFGKTTFAIPGIAILLSMVYWYCPLRYVPNDSKENKIRKILNYGLLYYYICVVFVTIGRSNFDKVMLEENSKQAVTIADSSSLVTPLSDSEKAAIKDSFSLEKKGQ